MIAIAGKNEKMKEAFEDVVNKTQTKNRICVLPFTNQVPEFMNIADVVITKPGGLTTSESLISSLPIVVINPLPGQEEENALFLEKSGAGLWLREDDNPEEVLSSLLHDDQKLASMKQNAIRIAKPYSTKEICEII